MLSPLLLKSRKPDLGAECAESQPRDHTRPDCIKLIDIDFRGDVFAAPIWITPTAGDQIQPLERHHSDHVTFRPNLGVFPIRQRIPPQPTVVSLYRIRPSCAQRHHSDEP
jgi:hypothetical protein